MNALPPFGTFGSPERYPKVIVPVTLETALVAALILLATALAYSVLAIVASRLYLRVRPLTLTIEEPVSILKPLSGLDLDLESNLRTFFEQDYTDFEILFAVRQTDDPAVEVVEKLRGEYSGVATRLIVTGEPPYANAKVHSLDCMLAEAANDQIGRAHV